MAYSVKRRLNGLSLIDLLVGLAVGMVATVVILNTMVMFDTRRRSTIGSTDAQINISFAGGWLTRELRIAGHGLNPSTALGCVTHRAAAGTPDASFTLVPATITQGQAGAPDTLIILAAGEQALPSARLIAPYTMGGGQLTLDSTLGVVNGNQLLLYAAGQADCALLSSDCSWIVLILNSVHGSPRHRRMVSSICSCNMVSIRAPARRHPPK
jgi:type IV pilus assembly protein PilW